jgi:hypothetical protein
MPYQYKREPLSDKETGYLTGSPVKYPAAELRGI